VKTILRQCAYCNQPSPAWKAGNGRFYCNEFCAWDGEAAARRHTPAPSVVPSLVLTVTHESAG
jgi:hypothetical protein